MNNCLKEIIAHHTCSASGGENHVLKNAPFKSEIKKDYIPFLGEGYYFWENNLELAKIYGNKRYNGKFFVLEFVLNINDERMLDLVGSREDILWFKNFIEKIKKHFHLIKDKIEKKLGFLVKEDITVGFAIELMKILNVFENIDVIKAIDASYTKERLNFRFKKEFLNLNPKIFYCFIKWENNFYSSKKIIFKTN